MEARVRGGVRVRVRATGRGRAGVGIGVGVGVRVRVGGSRVPSARESAASGEVRRSTAVLK